MLSAPQFLKRKSKTCVNSNQVQAWAVQFWGSQGTVLHTSVCSCSVAPSNAGYDNRLHTELHRNRNTLFFNDRTNMCLININSFLSY